MTNIFRPFGAPPSPPARPKLPDAVLVERLVRVAPGLIQKQFRRRRVEPMDEPVCGVMGGLCIAALAHLGLAGEPMDCVAEAWNARCQTFYETGVDHPDAYRHTNDPRTLVREGVTTWEDNVLTHLVIFVPSTRQIVDLAAFQLSRPEHDIELPGALALAWDGREALFESAAGRVRYQPWPQMERMTPPPMTERVEWTLAVQRRLRPCAAIIARAVRRLD
jgi:hypothetical protein